MKKAAALIAAIALILALAACTASPQQESPPDTQPPEAQQPEVQSPPDTQPPEPETPDAVELIVFAAASMTETMTEIAELYKEAAPHVTLVYTFDSSGTLLTQIKEGADCDVFISAAQKQMNELDVLSEANSDGSDYLMPDTRFNLVENRVALAVAPGNPAGVAAFEDVLDADMIALGNSDVPVGQYSEEIFKNMGIWDEMQSKVTFGSNVKEVTSWLLESAADCGVVYSTDAFSAGLEIVAFAPEGTLKTPVLYPAAALKDSHNPAEATAFLEFLKTPDASAVFESVGFGIPG